ncbi:MAG: hypothetical protein ACTHMC_22945 [Pseudobacter sp.]|uniref:hypothetical protein n=1 Tax=Pseudobacter sp. TaxID=2045420 RepID=UPI003F7F1591
MRKLFLLLLMAFPLVFCACKKGEGGGSPFPIFSETYYEQSPVNGRSSITFHSNFAFTVKDLRVSSGPVKFEYTYKLKDGKMIITPPGYDSYWHPNPVEYNIKDGVLTIINFRPHLWGEQTEQLTFKKM